MSGALASLPWGGVCSRGCTAWLPCTMSSLGGDSELRPRSPAAQGKAGAPPAQSRLVPGARGSVVSPLGRFGLHRWAGAQAGQGIWEQLTVLHTGSPASMRP